MKALVTGATGFVGRSLIARLRREHNDVLAAVRETQPDLGVRQTCVGDLSRPVDWSSAILGRDTVFHLAAAVHSGRASADELPRYRAINRDRTLELYEAASHAGVERFVFVSTAKVGTAVMSSDPYTISKKEAEDALRSAASSPTQITIVRPPLVYGPEVRANFRQLLRIVDRGWPLPFARVKARRSLLFVENLVDALMWCAVTPACANREFYVADGEPLLLPDLIRTLGRLLQRQPRLFGVPEVVLRAAFGLLGRGELSARLIDSFVVDPRPLYETGWVPPVDPQTALERTVEWFRRSQS